ncbi:hypothetical protein ACVGWJ_07330, partial [Enterobacter hormaechei]
RYGGKLNIQTVVSRETPHASITRPVTPLIQTPPQQEPVALTMNTETTNMNPVYYKNIKINNKIIIFIYTFYNYN